MLTVKVDLLGLKPSVRVLDLGCGDGRHARALRLVPQVAAVAVDIGTKEVRDAAESLRAMDDGEPIESHSEAGPWIVIQGSGYRLPFQDGAFDCVIVSEVLEHLHDDNGALAEITRVLRPGGCLAVSVPRWWPEVVCWALSPDYRRSEGGHVRIYRRAVLRRMLARYGYSVFAQHFAHALHSPYWWLKCAFGLGNDPWLIRRYHDLLVWDLFRRPVATRMLERFLNPFLGKSMVLYATRSAQL